MQQFLSILTFYKSFVLWSFIINIAITIINPYIFPAIVTKFLLTVFLWFYFNETVAKRKLILYKSLGISTPKLFSGLFCIDVLFTISFLSVVKEFI